MDEDNVKPSTSKESISSLEDNSEDILEEANLSQVRNLINENKIKLWVDPYYSPDTGANEEKLLQTANALATTLELDDIVVYQGIK